MDGIEKRIVYIIRSDVDPSRHYVGITNDLSRLEADRQSVTASDIVLELDANGSKHRLSRLGAYFVAGTRDLVPQTS